MIESTLEIARYCPLVIQGFSNFLGLFQGIMANPAGLRMACMFLKRARRPVAEVLGLPPRNLEAVRFGDQVVG